MSLNPVLSGWKSNLLSWQIPRLTTPGAKQPGICWANRLPPSPNCDHKLENCNFNWTNACKNNQAMRSYQERMVWRLKFFDKASKQIKRMKMQKQASSNQNQEKRPRIPIKMFFRTKKMGVPPKKALLTNHLRPFLLWTTNFLTKNLRNRTMDVFIPDEKDTPFAKVPAWHHQNWSSPLTMMQH